MYEQGRSAKIINEIVAELKQCGLGLKRKSVELSSYQATWSQSFLFLEGKIANKLKGHMLFQIEHFGSTSVPGLSAKPILDVMILFKTRLDLEASIPLLEELGFIYKGDAISKIHGSDPEPDRRGFSFYDMQENDAYINLHILVESHPDAAKNLKFRDLLRTDKSLAKKYENIKRGLKEGTEDRYEYTRSKTDLIAELMKESMQIARLEQEKKKA